MIATKAIPKVLTSFINNQFVPVIPSAVTLPNISPSTNTIIHVSQSANQFDVNDAVEVSKQSFEEWKEIPGLDRGRILLTAASSILDSKEELAYLETLESGIPIQQTLYNIGISADILRYYGGLACNSVAGRGSHFDVSKDSFCYIRREPIGVCAGIGAWNYPIMGMLTKVAPALACGNTFLFKPSENTPLTCTRIAELLSDRIPIQGVLSIILGDQYVGRMIVNHPGISKLSFTGSTEGGKSIAENAAVTLKRVSLELGGKSPLLVFDDCDVSNAVDVAVAGNFINNGQVCNNCTRVFVHRSIKDKFVKLLIQRIQNYLVVGDSFDERVHVGALMTPSTNPKAHYEKVMGFMERAKDDPKCTLLVGGQGGCRRHIENSHHHYYYVEPTIFECSDDTPEIATKEVFGPIMSLFIFDKEEEVISRANNATEFALYAGVMTNDLSRAHRVAKKLQAGSVEINNYNTAPIEAPFGGFKSSGYGKECGTQVLHEYSQLKTVFVESSGLVDSSWYRR